MATFKSTKVTNLDAQPPVHNPVGQSGGRVRMWHGTHEVTTAYTTGTIIVLDRLPMNLRIASMWLAWDDINDSTQPSDLGWYYPDGTVGDIDEFASALALGTATVMTQEDFEAAAGDIDRVGKMAWEWFGFSASPDVQGNLWDLCLTNGTNGGNAVAGTISWRVTGTLD